MTVDVSHLDVALEALRTVVRDYLNSEGKPTDSENITRVADSYIVRAEQELTK
jgi:hypothetical protein